MSLTGKVSRDVNGKFDERLDREKVSAMFRASLYLATKGGIYLVRANIRERVLNRRGRVASRRVTSRLTDNRWAHDGIPALSLRKCITPMT